jgi:leucyl aminopeptidase
MTKIDKVIAIAKRIIDLPYNLFSLENYFPILYKKFGELGFKNTDSNLPIKLMSNNHINSGIVTCNQLVAPYRKRNIYIIGKGILFDSGGLDLKREMNNMYDDKAGAIIALSVAHYLRGNCMAYCPITTNFVQKSLITPGDLIRIGKKNVRITSTDAEGRLILAEAINSLNVSKSDTIITIATLTGTCAYAIDTKATAYLTINEDLAHKFKLASNDANELSWRLPLWDYLEKDYFKKKEIKNYNKEIKADTIGASIFLKQFVKYPDEWIHLDIASSSFNKDGKANGFPIKSLINFIKRLK